MLCKFHKQAIKNQFNITCSNLHRYYVNCVNLPLIAITTKKKESESESCGDLLTNQSQKSSCDFLNLSPLTRWRSFYYVIGTNSDQQGSSPSPVAFKSPRSPKQPAKNTDTSANVQITIKFLSNPMSTSQGFGNTFGANLRSRISVLFLQYLHSRGCLSLSTLEGSVSRENPITIRRAGHSKQAGIGGPGRNFTTNFTYVHAAPVALFYRSFEPLLSATNDNPARRPVKTEQFGTLLLSIVLSTRLDLTCLVVHSGKIDFSRLQQNFRLFCELGSLGVIFILVEPEFEKDKKSKE